MARSGRPGPKRRAGPDTSPARLPPDPGLPGDRPTREPAGEYVQGFIEFLDKRWSRAEADLYTARRSVFLLSSVAIGFSMVIVSLAVAAAGFVGLVMLMRAHLGSDADLPVAALLGAVGASWLAVVLRRRVSRRRGRRGRRWESARDRSGAA